MNWFHRVLYSDVGFLVVFMALSGGFCPPRKVRGVKKESDCAEHFCDDFVTGAACHLQLPSCSAGLASLQFDGAAVCLIVPGPSRWVSPVVSAVLVVIARASVFGFGIVCFRILTLVTDAHAPLLSLTAGFTSHPVFNKLLHAF